MDDSYDFARYLDIYVDTSDYKLNGAMLCHVRIIDRGQFRKRKAEVRLIDMGFLLEMGDYLEEGGR